MSIFKKWFSGKNEDKKEPEMVENIESKAVEEAGGRQAEVPEESLAEGLIEDSADDEEPQVEQAEAVIHDEEEALESEIESETEIEQETVIEFELESEPQPEEESSGIFGKFFKGLHKTRENLIGSVEGILSAFVTIDDELFEQLEEALITADIGVETSVSIMDSVRGRVKKERVTEVSHLRDLVADEISKLLKADDEFVLKTPAVILVIGVNGVGKTTAIGKLANKYKSEGKSVILAAADTFRAAAIDQLEIWADRNNVPIVKHQENSDPAAVVYDAVQAAKKRNIDVLICDTAGRLHNKKGLMEELKKIDRIISKEYEEENKEVFLVLDATTGQNALQQAKIFKESAEITGIILTKLDGTAKGGIVIAIKNELDIPVRYAGVGEKITDIEVFDAEIFAKALFSQEG